MDKKPTKIYRFAFYGLSASGKTCLLAALGMPRSPHPLGYSCTWRPIDVSSADKDKQDILRHSQEWIKKAMESLSKREVPAPNAIGQEHFIFEYDFTGADHQTFRIQLIDYSGELLSTGSVETNVAKELRQKFIEMDGILVFAEAPYKDQLGHVDGHQKTRDAQAHKDLLDLRQTFGLLRGEKQEGAALNTPVVMLVNKWDRYSNIDYTNPECEQAKLEDFFRFNPAPPHKGLNDVLEHSVTKGNFKAFPISALGKGQFVRLENSDVVERPLKVQPLNAYGLEDPFLWLAQQRDAIDLQNYKANSLKNLKQCREQGNALLNRFPKSSTQAKQVKSILSQCRKKVFYYSTALVSVLFALWFTAETTMDVWNHKKVTAAIENPETTPEILKNAEQWLSNYIIAPSFRHLISKRIINMQDAKNALRDLQTRRENVLWGLVETAKNINLQAAVKPAQAYIESYPYGHHIKECQEILVKTGLRTHRKANEDAVRKVVADVEQSWQNSDALKKSLANLGKLPIFPESETEEMRQERIGLEKKISTRLTEIANQDKWEEFLAGYNYKIEREKFLAAANYIQSQEYNERLEKFKAEFKTSVILKIETAVKLAIKDDRLRVAEKYLTEYSQFPSELQLARNTEGYKKIIELGNKVKAAQDQALYEGVLKYKDRDRVQAYLQKAPLQTMTTEVSKYKKYLESIRPGAKLYNLRLSVKINWEKVAEDENEIRVYMNQTKVIHKIDVKSEQYSSTNLGLSSRFSMYNSDKITINISIIGDDWFGDDYNGTGKVTKQISDFAKGYLLQLKEQGELKTTAFIKIIGYPKEPNLPAWHGNR